MKKKITSKRKGNKKILLTKKKVNQKKSINVSNYNENLNQKHFQISDFRMFSIAQVFSSIILSTIAGFFTLLLIVIIVKDPIISLIILMLFVSFQGLFFYLIERRFKKTKKQVKKLQIELENLRK